MQSVIYGKTAALGQCIPSNSFNAKKILKIKFLFAFIIVFQCLENFILCISKLFY